MNIVLLDDLSGHNTLLKLMLERIIEKHGLPAQIALTATDFSQVLDYAKSNPPLTVYFLDIRLEQAQNGLDVLRSVRRDDVRDHFIIVSAYPHYAMDCLKAHAYDFLIKPIEEAAVEECLMSLWRELQADEGRMLDIDLGARTIRVPLREIWYIESSGRNLVAHTDRGIFKWAGSLSALVKSLQPYSFIQIHRRTLVNDAHVEEWNTLTNEVVVHGVTLSISRRMQAQLLENRRVKP